MIQLTKKDLEFLSIYNFCSDKNALYSDKFLMSSMTDSTDILFCQINSKNIVTTTILEGKNVNKKKFSYIFITSDFYKMCSLCSDTDNITIKNDGIVFGSGNTYKFESYDDLIDIYDLKKIDKFINLALNKIEIKSFNIFKEIDFCVGTGLYDNFALLWDNLIKKNYLVACDKDNITGVIQNDNIEIKSDHYFDSIIYKLLGRINKKFTDLLIEVNDKDKYYRYTIDKNNYIIIPFVESMIFNIFDDSSKELYEHKFEFIFKKAEMIKALERILVVTNASLDNRVFITLGASSITIENKDGITGKETVSASINVNIKNKTFVTQAHVLLMAIKELNKEDIIIKIDSDVDNCNVIKVEAKDINKFFIVTLLEKI